MPGDLVITEIMANPPGTDTGNEWFEVYNGSGAPVTLTGLRLVASRQDGTDEKSHTVELQAPLAPGTYFVFGGVLDELKPAHVDYGYADDLGALRNEAGRLALVCAGSIVDEVKYVDAKDGASKGFTGSRTPDAIGNDDPTAWCDATQEFAGGQLGSPGEANEPCAGVGPPGTCRDGDADRAVVSPAAGDLVITEAMPNPKAAADATGEWFELYVTRDVDLNGLELGNALGTVKQTLADSRCLFAAAGTYVVFARSSDPAQNGMLPRVDHVTTVSLTNSGGGLFVGLAGEVLDAVSWTSSGDGASVALDPGKTNPTDNDDPLSWCRGTTAFGAGDLGTPGAMNVPCPVVVPAGKCLDGQTLRDIVAPAPGQLVLNEVMANPAGTDTEREWFEVYVGADVDLNGIQVANESGQSTTLGGTTCLRVTQGSYVVFAKNDDAAQNGGLPRVDFVFTFTLGNSQGITGPRGLSIGPAGGTPLDAITWTTSTEGQSMSLDPDFRNPTDNDAAASFCVTPAAAYGAGGSGTPGAENPQCP